jgi:hypothetical protein
VRGGGDVLFGYLEGIVVISVTFPLVLEVRRGGRQRRLAGMLR